MVFMSLKFVHCEFPGVEILWKGTVSTVSGESPETMRKLCLSTKFAHQEIRWNYGIFCSGNNIIHKHYTDQNIKHK